MTTENGLSAAAEMVESVREDLRAHDKRDDERFDSLDGKIDGCRQDVAGVGTQVAWMRGVQQAHGVKIDGCLEKLDEIKRTLSRRARTEETLIVDTERFKKKRNLTILKTVLGLFAGGAAIVIGAWLHRWLG